MTSNRIDTLIVTGATAAGCVSHRRGCDREGIPPDHPQGDHRRSFPRRRAVEPLRHRQQVR
nr:MULTISPECIES: hypothetical protein [Kocuria]